MQRPDRFGLSDQVRENEWQTICIVAQARIVQVSWPINVMKHSGPAASLSCWCAAGARDTAARFSAIRAEFPYNVGNDRVSGPERPEIVDNFDPPLV